MMPYLIAMLLILLIALTWVGVQYAYRAFALRHPEWGPARESFGCGMMCTCDEPCEEQKQKLKDREQTNKPVTGGG